MRPILLCALLLSTYFVTGRGHDDVKLISPQQLTQYVLDHRLVAVFVYSGSCDKECAEKRQVAADGWLQSTDFLDDIVFVQSDVSVTRTGPWFDDEQTLPLLLYYRDALPIVYAGEWSVDMLSMWFSDSQESAVHELTDDTFEHDTQAATGATTGDWLVLFTSTEYTKCPKCSSRFTSLHTVASRLRSRFVFGLVNLDRSPKLKERFGIEVVPELYLFRRGRMHEFAVDAQSGDSISKQLEAFITGGYEKKDSQKVNLGPRKGAASSLLQELLPYLMVLGGIVLFFIIAGAILERIAKRQKKKSKSKSTDGDASSSRSSSGAGARRRV